MVRPNRIRIRGSICCVRGRLAFWDRLARVREYIPGLVAPKDGTPGSSFSRRSDPCSQAIPTDTLFSVHHRDLDIPRQELSAVHISTLTSANGHCQKRRLDNQVPPLAFGSDRTVLVLTNPSALCLSCLALLREPVFDRPDLEKRVPFRVWFAEALDRGVESVETIGGSMLPAEAVKVIPGSPLSVGKTHKWERVR
jgi:hypothetical protein